MKDLLDSIISKANEDGIITKDEAKLIETIKLQVDELESTIVEIKSNQKKKVVLQKTLASVNKLMLKNIISQARNDGRISPEEQDIIFILFNELGFEMKNFNSRPWFVFKICVNIDLNVSIDPMLDHLDKIFCLRGMRVDNVISGLCLGTKHYVIEDVDVTLLIFAVTPDTTSEWIRKGAFAILDLKEDFSRVMKRTAQDLIVENYFSKIK